MSSRQLLFSYQCHINSQAKLYSLNIYIFDQIINVKKKLEKNCGIPFDQQKLTYVHNGQEITLEDEKRITDYPISDLSEIKISTKLFLILKMKQTNGI